MIAILPEGPAGYPSVFSHATRSRKILLRPFSIESSIHPMNGMLAGSLAALSKKPVLPKEQRALSSTLESHNAWGLAPSRGSK